MKYLFRFNENAITAFFKVAENGQILGAENQHLVTELTTAIVMFFNLGYDVSALVLEYEAGE